MLRIVVLVNTTDEKIVKELIDYGASICITKPISHKKLLRAIMVTQNPIQSFQKVSLENKSKAKIKRQHLQVLVAEDNLANLRLIANILDSLNTKVTTTTDGKKAIEITKKKKFDLILVDLQMPVMNGLDATKQIREYPNPNQQTPIIAISAYISKEDEKNLLASGINEFLIKPVDSKTLERIIAKWIDQKQTVAIAAKTNKQLEENKIIDFEQSVILAGGKRELAKEMISLFVQELPNHQQELHTHFTAKDWQSLAAILHKIHGACSFCAIPKLQRITSQFEIALKEGEEDLDLYNNLFKQVNEAIDDLLKFAAEEIGGLL